MKNFHLVIEYDGGRYYGWQKQGNTEITVQGKIEAALAEIFGEKIEITGSGRTDAGVHAMSQHANFHAETTITCSELRRLINEKTENDISVKTVIEEDERFHSRYNAKKKVYLYRIWNEERPNVFERKYSLHISEKLDIEKMQQAAEYFIGTHDFRAFSSNKRLKKSTVCTIFDIEVKRDRGMILIKFEGASFLYNMVRILTGCLIEASFDRLDIAGVMAALKSGTSGASYLTAAPHGLFLQEVGY